MSRGLLLVLPALVLSLAACGGTEEPDAAPKKDEPSACERALAQDDAEELAGADLGKPRELPVGETMKGCVWTGSGGVVVQVIDAPAEDWAAVLPDLLNGLKQQGLDDVTGADKLDEALALLEESGDLDGEEGCALFSKMLELRGVEPGTTQTENLTPNAQDPTAANFQRCVDGRYRSVELRTSGIEDTPELAESLLAALEAND